MADDRIRSLNRARAKSMRATMEEAEFKMWMRLRRRSLGGFRFRRQAPIGPFIVDFLCPECRLIIEVDGSQHFEDDARDADDARTRWLERRGYRVIRASNLDVKTNLRGVCEAILAAAYERHPEGPARTQIPPHAPEPPP